MHSPKKISEIIVQEMCQNGISQAELSRRLNYERSAVNKQLHHGVSNLQTICNYAEAIHVTPEYLLGIGTKSKDLIPKAEKWEVIGKNEYLNIDIAIKRKREE